MITTRARSGSSRGRGTQPLLQAGIRRVSLQAREVVAGVAGEVEVELGNGRLHDAPRGLAGVRDEHHQAQRGTPARVGRVAEVRREKPILRTLVKLVVDRQVAEIEETVAHARVLPVNEYGM